MRLLIFFHLLQYLLIFFFFFYPFPRKINQLVRKKNILNIGNNGLNFISRATKLNEILFQNSTRSTMKSNQKPRRSLYYRTIYIYIYKSCTCPNNLDKNSFSLLKNRQFLEAGERGCSILINLYELSLPPTRQRKYSLNKESPLYRHILSRLVYLLRWKAS